MVGLCDNAGEMSPGSNTESYPAFARIGLRENPGKNLNQVTCPDRDSNPGHLVSQPDALTVTPQVREKGQAPTYGYYVPVTKAVYGMGGTSWLTVTTTDNHRQVLESPRRAEKRKENVHFMKEEESKGAPTKNMSQHIAPLQLGDGTKFSDFQTGTVHYQRSGDEDYSQIRTIRPEQFRFHYAPGSMHDGELYLGDTKSAIAAPYLDTEQAFNKVWDEGLLRYRVKRSEIVRGLRHVRKSKQDAHAHKLTNVSWILKKDMIDCSHQ
ncbi:hypothetical protein ANN_00712 [Periplaneta americana]|uniref:Uncharacterized protein n=1 Tax=Periplaneta americana TaxID=6978 RepID=A0ABQ8TUT7_PERAM|nr:hypothetical protein ANN_00712 [Periplaneta americana]